MRSRSPGEPRYYGWETPDPENRMASKSPPPYRDSTPQRRRSPSSGSSARSRSRSASPHERRRAVHRLPTANTPTLQPTVQTVPVTVTTGKAKKNKKNRSKQAATKQSSRGVEEDNQTSRGNVMSMPPPPVPPPVRTDRLSRQSTPDWGAGNVPASILPPTHGIPLPPKPMTSLSIPASLPERPARTGPVKHAGFKPIGQPNPALKMFFPGDDDEVDHTSAGNRGNVARNDHQPAAKNKGFVAQKQQPHRNGLEDQAAIFQRSLPPHQAEPWPSTTAPAPLPPAKEAPHVPSKANGAALPVTNESPITQLQRSWIAPSPQWWPANNTHERDPIAPPAPFVPHALPLPNSNQPPVAYARTSAYDMSKPSPQPSPSVPPPIPGPSPAHVAPPHPPTPSTATSVPTRSATPTPSLPPEPASQELYVIMNQVGEGTFGKVYKARNTASKIFVALKRIRMESEKDGFPVTAMREIKLLQSLKHANVVRLYEMMVAKGSVFMVFEYMDHDLTGILSQTQFKFSDAHLKSLCHQMLAGLAYLHHKGVIHRDIKGSNILLNNKGELKLADFGLARFYQKRRRTDYTNRVITLWYRPPELLFGATVYGAEVDMWSAGCIMLELFTKKPVFQGNDEIHQLHVIFKILGAPTVDRWPGLSNLPWYELIRPKEALANRFREYFQRWMTPAALDLAEQLLNFDPEQRVTAQDALQAPYFTQEQPMAELPSGLSTLDGEWHELETKQERMKKRKKNTESAAP
ncbi:CMGC/CDK/CRK7 protein kinase [Coprinopsis sp. MPI-PUGE-AT-0042]|nr:CMGC/CDK/CRK7 protein kinase [Coprinopsis sp. MPI-PUGE-AT-0042]